MPLPVTEVEFTRAREDLEFRRQLMVETLDLLLARIARLRTSKPAPDSAAAAQLRDGIGLAVGLADRLQALTKALDRGSQAA
jgi:hypothetical protein